MSVPPDNEALADSTDKLAEMVEALSSSLRNVGELQARTLALGERQAQLEAKSELTASSVGAVQEDIRLVNEDKVSKNEIADRHRKNRRNAFAVGALLLVVGVGLAYQVNENRIDTRNASRNYHHQLDSDLDRVNAAFASCQTRDAEQQTDVTLFDKIASALAQYPGTSSIVADIKSAAAEEPPIVSCDIYAQQARTLRNQGAQ